MGDKPKPHHDGAGYLSQLPAEPKKIVVKVASGNLGHSAEQAEAEEQARASLQRYSAAGSPRAQRALEAVAPIAAALTSLTSRGDTGTASRRNSRTSAGIAAPTATATTSTRRPIAPPPGLVKPVASAAANVMASHSAPVATTVSIPAAPPSIAAENPMTFIPLSVISVPPYMVPQQAGGGIALSPAMYPQFAGVPQYNMFAPMMQSLSPMAATQFLQGRQPMMMPPALLAQFMAMQQQQQQHQQQNPPEAAFPSPDGTQADAATSRRSSPVQPMNTDGFVTPAQSPGSVDTKDAFATPPATVPAAQASPSSLGGVPTPVLTPEVTEYAATLAPKPAGAVTIEAPAAEDPLVALRSRISQARSATSARRRTALLAHCGLAPVENESDGTTVFLSASKCRPREPVSVYLSGSAPCKGDDYVGIYRASAGNCRRFIAMKQIPLPSDVMPGEPYSRSITFFAPKYHGVFDFRVFDGPEESEPPSGRSGPLVVQVQGADIAEAVNFQHGQLLDLLRDTGVIQFSAAEESKSSGVRDRREQYKPNGGPTSELVGVSPPRGLVKVWENYQRTWPDAPAAQQRDKLLALPTLHASDINRYCHCVSSIRDLIMQIRTLPLDVRGSRRLKDDAYMSEGDIDHLRVEFEATDALWRVVRDVRYTGLLILAIMQGTIHQAAGPEFSVVAMAQQPQQQPATAAARGSTPADEMVEIESKGGKKYKVVFKGGASAGGSPAASQPGTAPPPKELPQEQDPLVAFEYLRAVRLQDADQEQLGAVYAHLPAALRAALKKSVYSLGPAMAQQELYSIAAGVQAMFTLHTEIASILDEVTQSQTVSKAFSPARQTAVKAWRKSFDPLFEMFLVIPAEAERRIGTEAAVLSAYYALLSLTTNRRLPPHIQRHAATSINMYVHGQQTGLSRVLADAKARGDDATVKMLESKMSAAADSARLAERIGLVRPEQLIPPVELPSAALERISAAVSFIFKRQVPGSDFEQKREAVRKRIATILADLPAAKYSGRVVEVSLFGSSSNGFGSEESDVDLAMTLGGPRPVAKSRLARKPTGGPRRQPRKPDGVGNTPPAAPIDKLAESSPADDAADLWEPAIVVEDAAALLQAAGMQDVVCRSTARIPLVLFTDPETHLKCDVCAGNELAMRNTALLRAYADADPRVRQLAFVVKRWAARREMNNASDNTLSSYGYVLMMLASLMRLEPHPVIPCLQAMPIDWPPSAAAAAAAAVEDSTTTDDKAQSMPSTFRVSPDGRSCDTYFWTPALSKAGLQQATQALQEYCLKNALGLGRLLAEFFYYYAFEFDLRRSVVSVRGPPPADEISKSHGGSKQAQVAAFSAPGTRHKYEKVMEHGWRSSSGFSIEDPFEYDYDVAHVLRAPTHRALKFECALAYARLAAGSGGAPSDLQSSLKVDELAQLLLTPAVVSPMQLHKGALASTQSAEQQEPADAEQTDATKEDATDRDSNNTGSRHNPDVQAQSKPLAALADAPPKQFYAPQAEVVPPQSALANQPSLQRFYNPFAEQRALPGTIETTGAATFARPPRAISAESEPWTPDQVAPYRIAMSKPAPANIMTEVNVVPPRPQQYHQPQPEHYQPQYPPPQPQYPQPQPQHHHYQQQQQQQQQHMMAPTVDPVAYSPPLRKYGDSLPQPSTAYGGNSSPAYSVVPSQQPAASLPYRSPEFPANTQRFPPHQAGPDYGSQYPVQPDRDPSYTQAEPRIRSTISAPQYAPPRYPHYDEWQSREYQPTRPQPPASYYPEPLPDYSGPPMASYPGTRPRTGYGYPPPTKSPPQHEPRQFPPHPASDPRYGEGCFPPGHGEYSGLPPRPGAYQDYAQPAAQGSTGSYGTGSGSYGPMRSPSYGGGAVPHGPQPAHYEEFGRHMHTSGFRPSMPTYRQ